MCGGRISTFARRASSRKSFTLLELDISHERFAAVNALRKFAFRTRSDT
jgi:hypothetical protein